MMSARYSFKHAGPALMYGDIRRLWPLWIGACLIWFFLLPVTILSNYHEYLKYHDAFAQVNDLIIQLSTPAVFIGGAAGLASCFFTHRYLCTARASCAWHSLPMTREKLWLWNCLGGLFSALIPVLFLTFTTILVCLLLKCQIPLTAILGLDCVLSASTLFGYGLSSICFAVSGNAVAAVLFFVISNAICYLLWSLISSVIYVLTLSVVLPEMPDAIQWLTPLWKILEDCGPVCENGLCTIDHPEVYGVYSILALVLLLLGGILYRNRQTETAGDAISAVWLRPVFRVVVGFFCGAGLAVMGAYIYADGRNISIAAFLLLMLFGSWVGWYAAEMILRHSVRIFDVGHLKRWIIFAAALCIFSVGMRLDIFHIDKRIPALSRIESVTVSICGASWNADPSECTEIHRLLSADVDRADDPSVELEICYELKNGQTIRRSWGILDLYRDDPEWKERLDALFMDPEAVCDRLLGSDFEPSEVVSLEFSSSDFASSSDSAVNGKICNAYFSGGAAIQFAEAIRSDILNADSKSSIGRFWFMDEDDPSGDGSVWIDIQTERSWRYLDLDIAQMPQTKRLLLEAGAFE